MNFRGPSHDGWDFCLSCPRLSRTFRFYWASRVTIRVNVPQDQNDTITLSCYYSHTKTSSEILAKLFRMAQSHFILTKSWALAFPNSHMIPLSISPTRVTQTTNIGLKTCSPLLPAGARRLVGSFSIILPKWVVCSLSSKAWICYLKNLFVEYPSLGDEGISEDLIIGL